MEFETALIAGQKSEEIVLDIIQKEYPSAFIKSGYHKEYDINIPEASQTVEVKQDFKSQYTGNIVVEIEMYGKPSGLSTTTADWWAIHISPEELIWITPETIKAMLLIEEFDTVEFIGKGDDTSKIAYLIPKKCFFFYCHKRQKLKQR